MSSRNVNIKVTHWIDPDNDVATDLDLLYDNSQGAAERKVFVSHTRRSPDENALLQYGVAPAAGAPGAWTPIVFGASAVEVPVPAHSILYVRVVFANRLLANQITYVVK